MKIVVELEVMNMIQQLRKDLERVADPVRAKNLQRYFKTGKGEYGEGDIFLGLTVPISRQIAKKYNHLDIADIKKLLGSKFHEERLIALLILVEQFNKGDEAGKKKIYNFYLKNTKCINNWDLVDLSSHEIVGGYLLDSIRSLNEASEPDGNTSLICDKKSKSTAERFVEKDFNKIMKRSFREGSCPINILYKLAKSKNIWERRIAVISTFEFIRNDYFDVSMELAEMLLQDEHDLIHKAVGWMLREVGKKDQKMEIKFLDKHYEKMPRIMLRYAIEKFPEKLRLNYLKKKD